MSLNPSPAIAALLSFFFPGVGQIYAGDLRKGVLCALPKIVFVLAIIWLLIGPKMGLVGLVTNPQTRVAILVLNVAFFLYHVAAMVDAYSANITPDPDTGIGTWTDAEIITAIREGKTPDGRIIFPPMPVPTYNNMSDDDVKAIVAYLHTIKPVHNEVPL